MERYYSSVFWHFLGSPSNINWHNIYSPEDILKNGKVKNVKECLDILKKIIDTKCLLARATEKILDNYETDKYCCLTDIPIKDLQYHKKYYGSIALGFNCKWVYKYFRPVLYFPKSGLPKKVNKNIQYSDIPIITSSYTTTAGEFTYDNFETDFDKSVIFNFNKANKKYDDTEDERFNYYWLNFIKVTEYSDNPKKTFYREREWRRIGDVEFDYKDIEAVIIPKYLLKTVTKYIRERNIYINIITWDLIEKS